MGKVTHVNFARRMPTLAQLEAFADWEKSFDPSKTHIAQWAHEEIIRLQEREQVLESVLLEALSALQTCPEPGQVSRARNAINEVLGKPT